MKTSVAITLITVGGLVILAPLLELQWQVQRAATYHEQHGVGSALPEEMRPQPHNGYDWASLAVGAVLVLVGVGGSLRLPAAARRTPQELAPPIHHCPFHGKVLTISKRLGHVLPRSHHVRFCRAPAVRVCCHRRPLRAAIPVDARGQTIRLASTNHHHKHKSS